MNDKKVDEVNKIKIEKFSNIFVGSMMVIAGIIMLVLAIISDNEDKGNVIPGLAVAGLGLVANTIFFRKYTLLNKETPNAILAVQARLYGAKSIVDACVTIALLSIVILPNSNISFYLDMIGSIIVSIYLIWCGIKTIFERIRDKSI